MKKHLLTLSLLLASFSLFAQVSLPNGNFEQWTTGTYDYPTYYPYGSNPSTFFRCLTPFNVSKTTDSYHGTYALQVTSNANMDTCGGYVINTNTANGNPSNWTGGMPYNQIPTAFRGYYKYNVANTDSALIIVVFRLANTTIGTYVFNLRGIQNSYTLFNKPFIPALTQAPDSVIIGYAASDMTNNNGMPGSTVKLDSLSFTGVTSQPGNLNGDMELWTSTSLLSPTTWYVATDQNGTGMNRTADKYAGNYAVELTTFLGDNNGQPRANAGGISTGYWSDACNCQKGGRPFTNQIDTLLFYYKYVPAVVGDSGGVYLTFKNNGITVSNAGILLPVSNVYTLKKIPFNTGSAIDSVIVDIQSSRWQDTTLVHIGADLKIDEMHFKSQPLTTGMNAYTQNEKLFVYPNPCQNNFMIDVKDGSLMESISIYDISGKLILNRVCEHFINFSENVDMTAFSSGSYIVEVKTAKGVYRRKLNKVE